MDKWNEECTLPPKLKLSQGHTPIYCLEKISEKLGKNIYIKRDDFTGIEVSGNKIRKLEYVLAEALSEGVKTIITCGAIQSNHARATVAACRKLGLDIHLVLRGDEPETFSGNLLIDRIMGAKVTYLSQEAFSNHFDVMNELKKQYDDSGKKAYIIPIGASNGIGNFGYFNAYNEILVQEREMGISFDTITCTIGSAGTYSGLLLGNYYNNNRKKIIGYSVGGSASYFEERSKNIIDESITILNKLGNNLDQSDVTMQFDIRDEYQGAGYAITNQEDIDFIKEVARMEGLILDPVYTGKCFKGLYTDIISGRLNDVNNLLFIHTGGLFGLEAFSKWF